MARFDKNISNISICQHIFAKQCEENLLDRLAALSLETTDGKILQKYILYVYILSKPVKQTKSAPKGLIKQQTITEAFLRLDTTDGQILQNYI